MKARFRFRNGMLVLSLPLIDPPKRSKSGKTLVVATTRGVRRTALRRNGKRVLVSANAFIRPDEHQGKRKPEIPKPKGLRKPPTKR